MPSERSISVLVIDDELSALFLTREHLERSGFLVTTVPRADKGLELLRSLAFDAVVSDYMMPGMDGIGLLKALREEGNAIPFILFTGRGREDVVIEALNSGADFYLQKGFEPESTYALLDHKIRTAVARRRADERIKWDAMVLEGINSILRETFAAGSKEDLGAVCLSITKEITRSQYGFIGQLDWDRSAGRAGAPGWWVASTDLVEGPSNHLRFDQATYDLADRALREGRGFFVNLPPAAPGERPYTTSFLGVPLSQDGEAMGVVGLGNKPGGYTDDDLHAVESLVPVMSDSLRRNRAEEVLRENEAQYRSLFENLEDRFQLLRVVRDGDGEVRDLIVLKVNPAYERFTGIKAEELVGKSVLELVPGAAPEWMTEFGKVEGTGAPRRGRTYDEGRGRHFETLIFRHAPGQVGSICRDITELVEGRKSMERMFHEASLQKAKLEAIIKTLPVGVGITDAAGRVSDFNAMIDTIWRGKAPRPQSMEEYGLFKGWWAASGKELAPEDWGVYRALMNGETSLGEVIRIRRLDGTMGTILHSSAPIVGEDGRVEGAVGAIQDITDNAVIEKALRESAEDLRRSNAELEQFAYVASHDLKEPLRMVTSYLQLLEKKSASSLDERSSEYLRFAVDGARRMNDLIDDLLAYSRVETRVKAFSPTDMNEVVGIVLRDLRKTIEERGAAITHDRLPEVTADQTQMVQLMQNLIGNALKFRGPEPPRVRISAEGRGTEWLFSVRDNGIGIPRDQRDRLFQMFQRLHTREEYEGTGIGLAICKKIVERHGGMIWVESEIGEGSTFFFTMPRAGG